MCNALFARLRCWLAGWGQSSILAWLSEFAYPTEMCMPLAELPCSESAAALWSSCICGGPDWETPLGLALRMGRRGLLEALAARGITPLTLPPAAPAPAPAGAGQVQVLEPAMAESPLSSPQVEAPCLPAPGLCRIGPQPFHSWPPNRIKTGAGNGDEDCCGHKAASMNCGGDASPCGCGGGDSGDCANRRLFT